MYGGKDCPDFVHKKVPQSRACNTDPCSELEQNSVQETVALQYDNYSDENI